MRDALPVTVLAVVFVCQWPAVWLFNQLRRV